MQAPEGLICSLWVPYLISSVYRLIPRRFGFWIWISIIPPGIFLGGGVDQTPVYIRHFHRSLTFRGHSLGYKNKLKYTRLCFNSVLPVHPELSPVWKTLLSTCLVSYLCTPGWKRTYFVKITTVSFTDCGGGTLFWIFGCKDRDLFRSVFYLA